MRKDMAKVIVERERLGGNSSRKGRTARKHSDLPKKESMKRPHRDRKQLNENLSPLRRYLKSNLGRPWDKIFSEICENIKLTSAVQKHVRDHVFDYVLTNIFFDGKTIYGQRRYGLYELFDGDFYVDPKTGLLRVYSRPMTLQKSKKRNPMEDDLNYLLRVSRAVRVEIADNYIFRIEASKKDPDVLTRSLATAANARVDAKMVACAQLRMDIQSFIKKYDSLDLHKDGYLRVFINGLKQGLDRRGVFSI